MKERSSAFRLFQFAFSCRRRCRRYRKRDRQPLPAGVPVLKEKGDRRFQRFVRRGRQRPQNLENLKADSAEALKQRRQEREIIVTRVTEMRFALLPDRFRPPADQPVDREMALLRRLPCLPAAGDLAEEADQGIGLLLLLEPVGPQGFIPGSV
jgi:hypothetical protein